MNKTLEVWSANLIRANQMVRGGLEPEKLDSVGSSVAVEQKVPLLVRRDGALIDGHYRFFGGMKHGKTEFDVIVVSDDASDQDMLETQIITAIHRNALTQYEEYVAFTKWLAYDPKRVARDVARKFDRDESMISKILSLRKCVEAVVQAAAKNLVNTSQWNSISKLDEADQVEALALVLSPGGATRAQIDAKRRKPAETVVEAVRVEKARMPLPNGHVFTIAGRGLTLDSLVDDAIQFLDRLKKCVREKLDIKTAVRVFVDQSKVAGQ